MGCDLFCSLLPQADGWTPLHAASHAGHVQVVKELLGGGTAVNQAKARWHLPCAVCRHIGLGACDSVACRRGGLMVETGLVCVFDDKLGLARVLP